MLVLSKSSLPASLIFLMRRSFSGQRYSDSLLFPALPTPTQLLHLLCIPPCRGHLPLTSFSALFVSLMRLLGRCCSLWLAGQLAPRSSCDPRPGWRDIFITHDKLEVQLPARSTSETCLASSLLSLSCSKMGTCRLTKTPRVSVFRGTSTTRTNPGLLLNYDS